MNKIIFFTKYTEKGPSSRYRSYQYKDFFEDNYKLEYYPLFNDEYIYNLYTNKRKKYFQILLAYFKRIIQVLKFIGTKNIIFIEYEFLPYFPPILEYLLKISKVKIIIDYDDAIFHNYDLNKSKIVRYFFKNKIPKIVKYSTLVITGSPYLTNYLSKFTNSIVEIPTSINFSKYKSNFKIKNTNDYITIGWIGSTSTSKNIINIKEVIVKINIIYPKVKFKFMGFDDNLKEQINISNVQFCNWSVEEEFNFLSSIDLGIMPLDLNPFNQGKCGFKLIQYMAMGKPTLSTPLEANIKINRNNYNLFATSTDEWFEKIIEFKNNLNYYKNVGLRNKGIIEKFYSIETNSIYYIKIFNQLFDVRN